MVINLCTFVEHTDIPYYGYKYREQGPILGNTSDVNTISKAHGETSATESTKLVLNINTLLLLLEACTLVFEQTSWDGW